MTNIAIRVENLSKRYRIGLKEELHDTMVSAMVDFIRQPIKTLRRLRQPSRFEEDDRDSEDIIWALKGVSFEVKQGEVVGIPSTGSGQALAAMGQGRPRLLRQAQYKAQDSLSHHRAHQRPGRDQWPSGLSAGGGVLSLSKGGHRLPRRTDLSAAGRPGGRTST